MRLSNGMYRALSLRGLSWLSLGDCRPLGVHRLVKLVCVKGGDA